MFAKPFEIKLSTELHQGRTGTKSDSQKSSVSGYAYDLSLKAIDPDDHYLMALCNYTELNQKSGIADTISNFNLQFGPAIIVHEKHNIIFKTLFSYRFVNVDYIDGRPRSTYNCLGLRPTYEITLSHKQLKIRPEIFIEPMYFKTDNLGSGIVESNLLLNYGTKLSVRYGDFSASVGFENNEYTTLQFVNSKSQNYNIYGFNFGLSYVKNF